MTIHPKGPGSAFTRAVREDCYTYFDALGADEVRRYMEAFPREADYNLVNYGCMRIYYAEIRDLFARCGSRHIMDTYTRPRHSVGAQPGDYKTGDDELWARYRAYVGEAARLYVAANA